MSDQECEAVRRQVSAIRADAVADLAETSGEILRMIHPAHRGEFMHEQGAELTSAFWTKNQDPELVCRTLRYVEREACAALSFGGPDESLVELCAETARYLARLESEPNSSHALDGARRWLRSLSMTKSLRQCFPLRWVEQRAFVDPALGMRYT
jgi:hypothetical protein